MGYVTAAKLLFGSIWCHNQLDANSLNIHISKPSRFLGICPFRVEVSQGSRAFMATRAPRCTWSMTTAIATRATFSQCDCPVARKPSFCHWDPQGISRFATWKYDILWIEYLWQFSLGNLVTSCNNTWLVYDRIVVQREFLPLRVIHSSASTRGIHRARWVRDQPSLTACWTPDTAMTWLWKRRTLYLWAKNGLWNMPQSLWDDVAVPTFWAHPCWFMVYWSLLFCLN